MIRTRTRFDPQRRTGPVSAPSPSPVPPAASAPPKQSEGPEYDGVLENIDRVMAKWGNVLSLLDAKFARWELNISNAPITKGLSDLLRTIDAETSRGGIAIPYALYKDMVRRNHALWGIDPASVMAARTGDVAHDSEVQKIAIASAIADVAPLPGKA